MSRPTRSRALPSTTPSNALHPPAASSDESDDSDDSPGDSDSGTTSVSSAPPNTTGTFRRKYNRLIDDCRKLEKKEGFSTDVQQVMTKNIESAQSLFQQLSLPSSSMTPMGGSRPRAFSENVGSAPGDIYMAVLHTKMISDVLRSKTESIGASNSGFKMDELINSLKRKATPENSAFYSPHLACKILAREFASASKTLPHFTAVVGSFDRDAISVPKEKKPRAPVVKKKFDEIEKTQDDVNLSNNNSATAKKIANHLMKVLRAHTQQTGKPSALYEFVLDPSSLNKSIESIFYVACLVHDGKAGLRNSPGAPAKDFAIEVTPEKKAATEEEQRAQVSSREISRNQYILSFSARMFKKLCRASTGEAIIPEEANSPGKD